MPEFRRKFRKKINELDESIEELGTLTIENYKESIDLFHKYSDKKYEDVNNRTSIITDKNQEIYEMAIKILALEQPVARDLRFIENSLKITNNMKRIGKLSQNIANVANEIQNEKIPKEPLDSMTFMAKKVEEMLTKSIHSFITKIAEAAVELEKEDDVIDDLFDKITGTMVKTMKENPESINTLVPFLFVARYLERIADRSENIGARVLIMQKRQI